MVRAALESSLFLVLLLGLALLSWKAFLSLEPIWKGHRERRGPRRRRS